MKTLLLIPLLLVVLAGGACQTSCSPVSPPGTADAAGEQTAPDMGDHIWSVFQGKDSTYWFGSDGQGVYRYDGKALVRFTTEHGLTSDHIRGIQEDRSGNIFVCTEPGGVSRFDGHGFVALTPLDPSKGEWKLGPDDLWFPGGQDTGAVYRWDGASLHRLTFPATEAGDAHYAALPRWKYPNARYSPYDVYTIFKDSRGHLWFGTAVLGACRYDGSSFAWVGHGENANFGVRAFVEDADGKFWLSNAVNRYAEEPVPLATPGADGPPPGAARFRKEPGPATHADPYSAFMSAVRDKDGVLWIATLHEGVWRFDGRVWTHFPVLHDGKPVRVYSIQRDRRDRLWLGTQENGVYRLDGAAFARVKFE
ncbi:MAG: hypothetical protein JNL50_10415 [Phycisphaerae bacterium]|nr:hypothetical protein [Phycisphaerae bacterium]